MATNGKIYPSEGAAAPRNHGETIQGLVGAGAPICDHDGTIYGAISIIGPVRRMEEERLETERNSQSS